MAIAYRDFTAPQTKRGGVFSWADWANFSEAVAEANRWIAASGVRILNVETVVMPGIFKSDEQGTEDTAVLAGGEATSQWHQFVRVWYEE
jgi:hypothetical protein